MGIINSQRGSTLRAEFYKMIQEDIEENELSNKATYFHYLVEQVIKTGRSVEISSKTANGTTHSIITCLKHAAKRHSRDQSRRQNDIIQDVVYHGTIISRDSRATSTKFKGFGLANGRKELVIHRLVGPAARILRQTGNNDGFT